MRFIIKTVKTYAKIENTFKVYIVYLETQISILNWLNISLNIHTPHNISISMLENQIWEQIILKGKERMMCTRVSNINAKSCPKIRTMFERPKDDDRNEEIGKWA